jgi:hypothetical protein
VSVRLVLGLLAGIVASLVQGEPPPEPLQLHPSNSHYFLWRGRPTVIVTSGEHYGAVLNLDFDYRRYLDTLARDGLNGTRVFVGSYVEGEGAFNIAGNTLNPAAGRFICPWARSDVTGYRDGGNKFDLWRWDDKYFERLRDFVAHAQRNGVIVEINLFSPMYEEEMWAVSPLNARNNVNGIGAIGKDDVFTMDRHGGTLPVQEAMVRKIVLSLQEFDNVYFEVCNEPYIRDIPMAWQRHMAETIAAAMRSWNQPFLISRNVANQSARVEDPHPDISILNFHYATPPDAVDLNYHLNRPIGDNETGFRGTGDTVYRMEAWDFLLAGGALFNHLDYSFTVGHEDGTFPIPPTQPGGGGPTLRGQLRILKEFMDGLDFVRMAPDRTVVVGGLPSQGTARALSEPGVAYAVYLRSVASTAPWSARWTGRIEVDEGGTYTFHTRSNDGVRLWLDGELVIDNWTDHAEEEDTATVRWEGGSAHAIRLEYFYAGGQGTVRLLWSRPGVAPVPVPQAVLSTPEEGAGLRGEYFLGTMFDSRWFERVDPDVNLTLGTEPPLPRTSGGPSDAPLRVRLPAGRWQAEWLDTKSGSIAARTHFVHDGGSRALPMPAFEDDIALRITRAATTVTPVARLLEKP